MTAGEIATFGTLLRRFRTAAGLTQEELAERAARLLGTATTLRHLLSASSVSSGCQLQSGLSI